MLRKEAEIRLNKAVSLTGYSIHPSSTCTLQHGPDWKEIPILKVLHRPIDRDLWRSPIQPPDQCLSCAMNPKLDAVSN